MGYENMNKKTLIKILREKDRMLKILLQEKKELNHQLTIDEMTGAINKGPGLELLEKEFELAKVNNENFVLCFVDVDRLKEINDTFGHQEGDRAIVTVVKILKENIRKTDFVVKMGGDEFIVVFPGATMRAVNKVWCRISKMLEETNKTIDKYNLSVSHGVFEYIKELHGEMDAYELRKRADAEMYKEKFKKKDNHYDI